MAVQAQTRGQKVTRQNSEAAGGLHGVYSPPINKNVCRKTARKLLAERLRAWRKQRGVPLKTVAQELGVSTATWGHWETGARFPSEGFINLLARYLGMPVCHLFSCAGAASLPLPACAGLRPPVVPPKRGAR